MRIRKLTTSLMVAFLGVTAAATSASRAYTHKFLYEITKTSSYALSQPRGMAFGASGNLVLMSGLKSGGGCSNHILIFSSTGSFQEEPLHGVCRPGHSVAFAASTGELYAPLEFPEALGVLKPAGAGGYTIFSEWSGANTPAKSFAEPVPAYDNASSGPGAGDLYVLDEGHDKVDVMRPKPAGPEEADEGEYLGELQGASLEHLEGLAAVAIDEGSGNVYVSDPGKHVVYEFNGATRQLAATITGSETPTGSFGDPTGVAVDQQGDLYVADQKNQVVDEFHADGKYAGQLTGPAAGTFASPLAVGIAPDGNVYVSDVGPNAVDVFGPNLIIPDVTLDTVSNVKQRSVTLNGTVNPDNEEVTDCYFEYYGPGAVGEKAPCSPAPGNGASPVHVSADIVELGSGGTYSYRLVAANANGMNHTSEQTVTLEPAAPTVNDQSPSAAAITTDSAALSGTIDPGGSDTLYHFVYGTTAAYGSETPSIDTGSGSLDEEITPQYIEGLTPGTKYHFALVAKNALGEVQGPDYTFTTAAVPTPAAAPAGEATPIVQPLLLSSPPAPTLVSVPSIKFPSETGPVVKITPKSATCKVKAKRIRNAKKRKKALKRCESQKRKRRTGGSRQRRKARKGG